MPSVRPQPEPGEPGIIYEMGGTLHGSRCIVTYDRNGDFTLRTYEQDDLASESEARGQLENWMRDRGITPKRSQPAIFLA